MVRARLASALRYIQSCGSSNTVFLTRNPSRIKADTGASAFADVVEDEFSGCRPLRDSQRISHLALILGLERMGRKTSQTAASNLLTNSPLNKFFTFSEKDGAFTGERKTLSTCGMETSCRLTKAWARDSGRNSFAVASTTVSGLFWLPPFTRRFADRKETLP
jgi:hypothetical protein